MPRYSQGDLALLVDVLVIVVLNVKTMLQDKWSPALQIRTVLLSIQALMSAPNPDDPLDNGVAEMWKNREAEALRTGKKNSTIL